jgi:septal ring-binding cell division protein DamX
VSATETPQTEPQTAEGVAPAPVEHRCPRCSAPLRDDQEWCLQCGTGVGARVAPPRGWRVPVAVVTTLLALILIAVVLAIVQLARNGDQVTTVPPTAAAPAPTAAPTTAPTAAPTQTATPTAASGGTSSLAQWPAGKTGFTVVLESDGTLSAATARARELAAQGLSVGILDTTGYRHVAPNRYVVFSGVYADRPQAGAALRAVRGRVAGAQVARVAPS